MTFPFRSPAAKIFFNVYNKLSESSGGPPAKADLTPERFFRCLGDVYIVQATSEGLYFRLFGTRIRALTGKDMTARFLGEGLTGADLDHVEALHHRCLNERFAIATVERLTYPMGVALEVEILRTPWADEQGVPRFVCDTFSAVDDRQWLPETNASWKLGIERNIRQPIEIPIDAKATT